MLVEFSVKNFRSIRDLSSISLLKRGRKASFPENSFPASTGNGGKELLKSAIVYGANASGKSNLVRAVVTMRNIVLNSGVGSKVINFLLEPFRLDEHSPGAPTLFEMELLTNGRRYRYGFECTREHIVSEWLHMEQKRMTLLFAREHGKFVEASPSFKELKIWNDAVKEQFDLPKETLFLPSVAKMFAQSPCADVLRWFSQDLIVLSGDTYDDYVFYTVKTFKQDPEAERKISTLVAKADLGISALAPKLLERDLADNHKELLAQVDTVHTVNGKKYTLDMQIHESTGTQKVFCLSAPLIDVLQNGKVLFIDEFDAGLHPLLVCALIELFHGKNKRNAQIVTTAHSPSILTELELRRDQIWFADKNESASTFFRSLYDFKGVRGNYAAVVKDYYHGGFGGVPNIKALAIEEE